MSNINVFYNLPDDPVYLENEAEREEYVLADTGLIWRGSYNRLRPTVWKFSQFENEILECALYLMIAVGKVRVNGRNDPVVVSRCLSAAVSKNDCCGLAFNPNKSELF